ncbi:MAG: septum formation protein Maf [Ignavibacteriales bacterium]|nr:septum formation protein Maf [Ignavibacteriales bacterium]
MLTLNTTLYLVSKSPRRRKLLKQLGLNFKSFSVDVDEKILQNETPTSAVKRIAIGKMQEAEKKIKSGILLTADTIVVLKDQFLGKPKNKKDAERMLGLLSNKTHLVYTGFYVKNLNNKEQVLSYEKTKVTFRKLTEKEIRDYIATGSPLDKAGAYGIQDDFGAVFVKSISGCYYNVVGLPISKIYSSLIKITS